MYLKTITNFNTAKEHFDMKASIKKRIAKATSVFAWILVVAVTFWFGRKLITIFRYESTNDAQVTAYINPVVSRVGGYVETVRFTDFEQVQKGDTLFIIDNREYVSETDQVQAGLQRSAAETEVLRNKEATLQEEAVEAGSIIAARKAEVWKQQLEYERYLELYNRKSATAQQLEEVKARLEVCKSSLDEAVQHYRVAVSRIKDLKAEEGVVRAEKSRLSELRSRKDFDVQYTVITAPYNGRMGKRTVEPGQMIKAGEHLAYIVNDETPKWVMANFKETQIAGFHIHDRVEVVADAFPDLRFTGKIIAFAPATGSSFSLLAPDNATGNFVKIVQRIPVKIEITGPDAQTVAKLQAGMNVEVTVRK